MTLQLIPLVGLQPANPEYSTTQVPISLGASGTFSAASTGVCTLTFTSAHGLTMTPAAGVLPNYYVSFGGSTSGLSGTGILVGNFFRLLAIPSTTTIQIYSTITAATVTSLTCIPVFFPSFATGPNDVGGQPTQSSVNEPFPVLAGVMANIITGANCVVSFSPFSSTNPLIPLDGTSTTQLGGTPATAPTVRNVLAASSAGQLEMAYPWSFLQASGSSGTTYVDVIR